jgi:lambda family phage portal protein
MWGFQPSRLGPTTSLWSTHDLIVARCRDLVRNNPWASSAIDNFESQVIGNGIRPRWNIQDPVLKAKVELEFGRWAKSSACDSAGLLDFYGIQCLAAREVFEAGEVLSRFYVRPPSWNLRVPLQLQLIESEQLPIFRNIISGGSDGMIQMPLGNTVRVGIEFDKWGRRVAYQLYKENPGETMFFPLEGIQFMRVPAVDMLHVYKPKRAGQLRGEPHMTNVLALLYELEQYTDASLVKKKIQTMFAYIFEKPAPDGPDLLPVDQVNGPPSDFSNPQTNYADFEPGTCINTLPGETVKFPPLPQENDFQSFVSVELHKLAIGVGATYEQLTGDLKGVNYSSIRAGLLDFRRKCEQFQRNIIIRQFCHPVVCRWLFEAVFAGVISLPGYASNPSQYEDIAWSTPRWDWVDPLKDAQAAQQQVRSGFTSREAIVAELGEDVATIDAQTTADNKRADELGLIHDTDPRKVLIGRESNPVNPSPGDPSGEQVEEQEEEAGEEQEAAS